jgi:hypothetical protein
MEERPPAVKRRSMTFRRDVRLNLRPLRKEREMGYPVVHFEVVGKDGA